MTTMREEQRASAAAVEEPVPGQLSPLDNLIALGQELATTQQQKYQNLARLAASDLQLAVGSLLKILVLAVVTAGLLLAAWITAMATGWQAVVAAGMDPLLAGLLVTATNIAGCVLAVGLITRYGRLLTLPYLRAALGPNAKSSS